MSVCFHSGSVRSTEETTNGASGLTRRFLRAGGACAAVGKPARSNFYEQGIAAITLCEAYGITRDRRLRRPAQKAIDFIVRHMGKNGGYGYSGAGNDAHVTSFQVMAVKSAKLSPS